MREALKRFTGFCVRKRWWLMLAAYAVIFGVLGSFFLATWLYGAGGPVGPARKYVITSPATYALSNGSRVRITPVHTYLLNGSVGEECLLNGKPMKGPVTLNFSSVILGRTLPDYLVISPNCTATEYVRNTPVMLFLATHVQAVAAVEQASLAAGAVLAVMSFYGFMSKWASDARRTMEWVREMRKRRRERAKA